MIAIKTKTLLLLLLLLLLTGRSGQPEKTQIVSAHEKEKK
jgi:hypothetical protein